MSDSNDDVEVYSSMCELDEESRLELGLIKITECELSQFNDQNHMINYMKKIARNLLEQLYSDF
jgi:hypothetical protein